MVKTKPCTSFCNPRNSFELGLRTVLYVHTFACCMSDGFNSRGGVCIHIGLGGIEGHELHGVCWFGHWWLVHTPLSQDSVVSNGMSWGLTARFAAWRQQRTQFWKRFGFPLGRPAAARGCWPPGIIAASLSVLLLRTAAATAGADRDSFRKSPIAKSGGHGFSE